MQRFFDIYIAIYIAMTVVEPHPDLDILGIHTVICPWIEIGCPLAGFSEVSEPFEFTYLPISTILAIHGAWACMGIYGHIWAYMGIYGHIWAGMDAASGSPQRRARRRHRVHWRGS